MGTTVRLDMRHVRPIRPRGSQAVSGLYLPGPSFLRLFLGDTLAEEPPGFVGLHGFERGGEVGVGGSSRLLGAVPHALQFAGIEGFVLP